jgi:hypothetical protein
MSGRLVSIVFDSALPAWLKPYAAAFASFAADDGSRVHPSIKRVARMVGRAERSTQRAVHELRACGVLDLERGPGHHRAARYVFRAAALPRVGDPDQLPLFPQAARSTAGGFPQLAQVLTGHPRRVMGDTSVTRSVSDPSFTTHPFARARERAERANTRKTGT